MSEFMIGRRALVAGALAALPLGGCFTQTMQRGYVMPENALEQVPIGSTQEQVLIVLGTPSTVATLNGEVFYYISQTTKQTAFLDPKIVDQRVLAVYFEPKARRVTRVANYGLQDGKVFDFIGRSTSAGGEELSFLRQVLSANKSS
ncbi:outer membrane protein assembly factor BamE [Blastochloris viridis]|uniref:Outer membrane lipoprotein OmlA n=1 Tax=Blastochloris viridis TaxID=1079 RepID=A0A0H5BD57_BLAVI|nr:outer membrane protein assembly factor BamE [Blastochloris viridis]ALK09950.1 Outer membrane protein assembly factor BamE [Blastochloris viridis]BAS00141.1 outer membrane lipoprotein OmlA [Blastochloris viridis]CUU42613.1 SmpA / OmlA family protein [Blastochloris viridis]